MNRQAAYRICVRWQEVRWDDEAMKQRLVYSCECAGSRCPFDPRRMTTDQLAGESA